MTAPEAEHILCGAPKNSFLVRFASTHPGSFAISYSVSEDPLNPNAEFDVCHVLVERTESESGSSGFFVREGNEEPRVFSSLVELVNDWVRKHKMSSKCPQNVFEEPYCFGEISEDDAASNLELEPPGTYLLRVQPRFTLFYKSILGPMPVFGPDGVKEPSKSSSDSVGDSSNPNLVCMPGRFFLCFMLSGNRVQHEELKRDVEGRWMFGGKAHSTLSDLLNSNTALFVKPYTHLPSISPIMQDDQDDRELVLQSLLQDEEGEDGYAIDLRSAMIRPLPKTEESVAPLIAKIQSNMESPPVADVENLLDYLAKSGPDVIEKLLRPRTRRGTSIFGSIKKDFLRTDVVRLESLSLPTNRLVKMIFTLTAGDKPIRWSLQDPCKISSLSFFACTPSDGILAKGESVTIRVCVVLYKCIAMMRLLRLLIFNGDGSFQTCLPIFIRVVADVQSSILRSNDSKISDESEPYWRIPPHALTDTNLLESGTTANVFRAVLLGATVVQKRFILRQSISDPYSADLKAFETELNVLRTTRHDNIASFVGAWCDPDTNSVFIVLKYAEHGSLANFLGQADGGTIARPRSPSELLLAESTALAPSSSTQPFAPATSSPVLRRTVNSTRPSKRLSAQLDPNAVPEHPPEAQTFAFKLSMALDTARAIHYLHRHNLLHRDIKTQNLLVDAYYRVQLADFGESRSSNTSLMTMARGTPKYRAPELYTRIYNNKVDIFSLGLVMAELFGGKIPSIPGFTESSKPLAPEMSQELPTSFLALIKACCLRNPTKRPTAKQVVQILNEIRKEILDAEGHPRLSPRSRFSPFENSSNTN
jgi:serine/threonine protein kinase